MKAIRHTAVALAIVAIAGCAGQQQSAVPANTLLAAKASTAPSAAKGDRADIRVSTRWSNGVLTSVVSRKLVTGSRYEVQFSDLGLQYPFGFAAFDNAQVRHAMHFDAKFLAFAR